MVEVEYKQKAIVQEGAEVILFTPVAHIVHPRRIFPLLSVLMVLFKKPGRRIYSVQLQTGYCGIDQTQESISV